MTMYETKTKDTYFQFVEAGAMSGRRSISILPQLDGAYTTL